MSDDRGKLIFYTNGFEIRNLMDQVMVNGSGLSPGSIPSNPNQYGDCFPTTHSPLFLPAPGSDSLYFIFHPGYVLDNLYGDICGHLYYTRVDMRHNHLGEVTIKNKSVLRGRMISNGGLTATKHGNGRDWWIVMQELGSNCFYKCILTASGVDSVGKQCIGDTVHWAQERGSCVFSPDGSKYIWSSPYFEHLNILDFNRCEGTFSNHRRYAIVDSFIKSDGGILLDGVSVSPNSKYLYLATGTELRQFDLTADSIDKSEVIIDNTLKGTPQTSVMFCQLAMDGKIYICPNAQDTFLHVINYPDSPGLTCGFVRNAIELPCWNTYSLSSYPNYRLGTLIGSECDSLPPVSVQITAAEKEKLLSLFPNPATDYITIDYGFTDWSKGEVSLEITNDIGQLMHRQKLPMYSGFQKLDVSNYSSGIYTAAVKRGNAVVSVAKFAKE